MALVETVLGAVLQVVIDKLASKEVINFFKTTPKLDQSLVHTLKNLMLSVSKLLHDGEEKQITDPAVDQWLHELKHWFFRAEEVVDELATQAFRSSLKLKLPPDQAQPWGAILVRDLFPSLSFSSSFDKTITIKIKEVTNMLDNMLNQKDALGLRELSAAGAGRSASQTLQRVPPSTSLLEDSKVFGRDQEMDQILEFLLSDEPETNRIGVKAIVGMGGLGKTTLAKMVYNHEKLQESFDFKVWVCVSDQFDIPRVTQSILESISGQPYTGSPDLNFLQHQLSAKLKGKKFLLVMDDVWNENYGNWELLRTPLSAAETGSKIIITTRNDQVALTMQTACMLRLKPLLDEHCWSLFTRHAFELVNSTPTPYQKLIGQEIVRKCQGLPLAIKTLDLEGLLPEEGLPPSLGCLFIRKCPKIQQKCQRKTGQYWNLIRHIPVLNIGNDSSYFDSFPEIIQYLVSFNRKDARKVMEDNLGGL